MRIRSVVELDNALTESLAWRKKEILALCLEAQRSREHLQVLFCRAAMLVLYAHWEGFVKEGAEAYLSYVSRQGRAIRQLRPGIVALLLRDRIRQDAGSDTLVSLKQLLDFFFYNLGNKPEWPKSGLVITESNLASRVLDNIFCGVGLVTPTILVTKGLLLEKRLVMVRHQIAHGQRVSVPVADMIEIKDHLLEALDALKIELVNAATQSHFLAA